MEQIEKKFKLTTVDVVVGGPPCQGFSKHRHKDSGVDDPRNLLLFVILNIFILLPRSFLL
jgi:DNA (cytosine-5)-methyltransferase 1